MVTVLSFKDINECLTYGICSQGCVNKEGSYFCVCAKDFNLKTDKKSCMSTGHEGVLVYATPKRIKSIGLSTGFSDVVARTKQAIGVTFDGQSYYWTEIAEGKEAIVKQTPGRNKEILLTAGLETPEDLFVDWLTGNIYFTDASRPHIAVCNSNGYHCTELISTPIMEKPRGIVLHPPDSLLFWTEWGANAHIGVAYMDGTEPKVLIGNVAWPNGITLDWPNRRIYWVDAQSQSIESATIEGQDRRKVLEGFLSHPYGIAVFENRIYWSDWDTKSIESCEKFTGREHHVLVQGEQIYGKNRGFVLNKDF